MRSTNRPVFSDAVRHFWATRRRQASDQKKRGTGDQGARSSATGGKQLDGFVNKIAAIIKDAGVDPASIYRNSRIEVPGFFRPTKKWDILVVEPGTLVAAIELKSHVGPSFGNNVNNRVEEALGSSIDILTAFREGAFQTQPRPWLGYLLLVEDCERSQRPVQVSEPHFEVFKEFKGASYVKRYEILCRKLVLEQRYDGACFLITDGADADAQKNYSEPAADLSASQFLSQLVKHVSR